MPKSALKPRQALPRAAAVLSPVQLFALRQACAETDALIAEAARHLPREIAQRMAHRIHRTRTAIECVLGTMPRSRSEP